MNEDAQIEGVEADSVDALTLGGLIEKSKPEVANENKDRCPICGGLNPGDITHTRC
jgi:hypothetical protein